MRLVLDTNVVLSGLLWTGSPMRLLAAAQAGETELFTSRALAPEPIAPVILADPADDHVLACALAARAHAIVSGDRHLLALTAFRDIPVLTPADALARISAGR